MKVLVTGGAGFIGANLVRRLLLNKETVHILQPKKSNLWRLKDIKRKLTIHNTSLTKVEPLQKLLHNIQPKIIYHLAAHGAYSKQQDIQKIISTNINGTVNLMLATKDLKLKCFINTGSSAEYGKKDKKMNENDYCEPETIYAASKLATTNIATVFSKRYNLPIITLRPFSVYGPYENKNRFIPTIISSLLDSKPIKITTDKIRHDYIYIDDVVDAYVLAASNPNLATEKVFNVGTGKEYTCNEVVKMLFEISRREVSVKKSSFTPREWDNMHWKADNFRSKKILGLKTKTTLRTGLTKTMQWFISKQNAQA